MGLLYSHYRHKNDVDGRCIAIKCLILASAPANAILVLNSKQFARRWRECNRLDTFFNDPDEEDEWRNQCLQLLSKAHTLGGIIELSLEVISSHYAVSHCQGCLCPLHHSCLQDFAFELECEAFKWRWETYITPPKISTEILSKHLIMPLISINHLAFASADPVSELSETDLEQVRITRYYPSIAHVGTQGSRQNWPYRSTYGRHPR